MQRKTLTTPVRLFTSSEYGTRIIFTGPSQVNPRDKLGKIGINFHNWFTGLFHPTVKVNLPVVNKDGTTTERLFRMNRYSLIEYVNASNPPVLVHAKSSDDDLLTALDDVLQGKHAPSAPGAVAVDSDQLRHAGNHNQRKLFNVSRDGVRAKFFGWLYQNTIGKLSTLKLRFLFANKEAEYFNISEMLAKRRFLRAKATVPAYTTHIEGDALFMGKRNRTFADIPPTSKENYIKVNQNEKHRLLYSGGRFPLKGKTDTSTGTTGKPTRWRRNDEEVRTVKKSLRVAAEIEYGDRHLEYTNAFALGPWATGMTGNEIMRETGVVFSAGADMEKVLDQFEDTYVNEQDLKKLAIDAFVAKHPNIDANNNGHELVTVITNILGELLDQKNVNIGARFDHYTQNETLRKYKSSIVALIKDLDSKQTQPILACYPPFMNALVDYARQKKIDFKKYHVRAIVGGQSISEALREKLIKSGFSHVNSSYGASDLDINIGMESDFEIALRKILEQHPEIAEELYGKNKGVPMVFHYDPFNYHIESDKDDKLFYTCNRSDRASPRIRYDLGDKGRVYACSDILAILNKHGIDMPELKPNTNLPLLFVWGRDSAVAYEGCKVSFNDLERALTNIDENSVCAKRAFYDYQDENGNDKVEIWIELAKGVAMPDKETSKAFLNNLLVEMGKVNQDFRSHTGRDDNAKLPALRFFTYGHSCISNPDGQRKQVLVFNPKNLPAGFIVGLASKDKSETQRVIVKKDDAFVQLANAVDAKTVKSALVAVKKPESKRKLELIERPEEVAGEVEKKKKKRRATVESENKASKPESNNAAHEAREPVLEGQSSKLKRAKTVGYGRGSSRLMTMPSSNDAAAAADKNPKKHHEKMQASVHKPKK